MNTEASEQPEEMAQTTQALNGNTGRFLINTVSGKCLDVAGAPGTGNNAPLQLWDCETKLVNPNGSQTDQLWKYSNGHIVNMLSSKCMDVPGLPGTAQDAPVNLYNCEYDSGSDQWWDEWFIDSTIKQYRSRPSGRALDIAGAPGTQNGARAEIHDWENYGNSDQYWRWSPNMSASVDFNGGYYTGNVAFSGDGWPANMDYDVWILGEGNLKLTVGGGRTSASGTFNGSRDNIYFYNFEHSACRRTIGSMTRQVVFYAQIRTDPTWFSVAQTSDLYDVVHDCTQY